MRVLHVCTEVYPLLKTGGLADVVGALPIAQSRLGCDARILVPGFPAFRDGLSDLKPVAQFHGRLGADNIRLVQGVLPGTEVAVYMLDAPQLYDRPGNPYEDAHRHAYHDNYRRFALLGWMAARLAEGVDPVWSPQVVHGHDWHAGLAPAYLRAAEEYSGHRRCASVMTVHNIAYQGTYHPHIFGELDLPGHCFGIEGGEFYGQFSFLKAGLFYADRITTVSPTYAAEIQEPEQGYGLNGLLKKRSADLVGILNGVDETVWNPATDPSIAAHYEKGSMSGKAMCKAALQQACGLRVQERAPLFGVVSRLAEQKGLHLILEVLPELIERGGQFVLLGSGSADLEHAFREAAAANPQSVSVTLGYDEAFSHCIYAGCDAIVVPSHFEPCGLTQLYGLRYGTLPVVRRVGGLADTVVDCSLENMAAKTATGFTFEQFDSTGLVAAVRRAFALYDRPADWEQVQRQAMQQHFGWDTAAARFISVYEQAL